MNDDLDKIKKEAFVKTLKDYGDLLQKYSELTDKHIALHKKHTKLQDSYIALQKQFIKIHEENNRIRYLLTMIVPECIHCGLKDTSKCPSGFPGCALADDLSCETPELKATALKLREVIQKHWEKTG